MTLGITPRQSRNRTRAEGKSRTASASDKAWIIVKGEHLGQAMLAQKLYDRFEQGFGIEIATVECGVAMDIVEDRFWSWNTLQVLRRLQTNLQDVLHDGWLGCDGGWWRVTGTRAGVQSHNVTGIGLAQPLEPFAHPGA